MADEKKEKSTIWVVSNRKDDRVVLFERDPAHPGGEAFVGGSGPAEVAKTPEVQRLLREGLVVQIPEPPDNRKKPVPIDDVNARPAAAQPGEPVKLGREMDPEVVLPAAVKDIEAKQKSLPQSIPVPAGVVVPPAKEK